MPGEHITAEGLSVSSIINSVREARGASQQPLREQQSDSTQSRIKDTAADGSGEYHIPYSLFNTHRLVSQLMEIGFTREQATSTMTLVKYKVYESMERLKSNMLTKSDLENDAYLFRAALQELRTETQMIRKNDQAILESQAAAISRDIESLAQKLNDEVDNLRSDIQIELNNHKHDSSHEMKSLDMELHTLASKYQVVMGEMKTDIEAIKLESIRKGMVAAVITTLVLLAIIWAPELLDRVGLRRKGKSREPGSNDGLTEGQRGGGVLQAPPVQARQGAAAAGGAGRDVSGGAAAVGGAGAGRRGESLERGSGLDRLPTPPDGRSLAGQDRSGSQLESGEREGVRYRDHSHLNIRYDPTISAAESQFGSMQQRPASGVSEDPDGYDDWFDAFFYSPQDIDRRRSHARRSASLVDSDPTFDAAFWGNPASDDRADVGNGGRGGVGTSGTAYQTSGSSERAGASPGPASQAANQDGSQRPAQVPLNFSPSDTTNTDN
ncbi:hypothetical protein LPJ61_004932 [Coemansia biformis]|uniref:DUF1640-domain-containing protein n=1 Tax=Coemansia biformis TaxID=1286918 RepID=A0A9W7YAW0_9FUNG|nr:hypothetical protein LPJ61_004932 [Coemansia biformis]